MSSPRETERRSDGWPALPLAEWQPTLETLHMWTQIIGKIKLDRTPFLNEWWNVALQLTARGLSTGPMPSAAGVFDIEFDFLDHNLFLRTSDGGCKALPLRNHSVASFYREVLDILDEMGIDVRIDPLPVEVPNPIRFERNDAQATYDSESVQRWWRILGRNEIILQQFRSTFVGKSSPIQFFWGSFDQSHTRFSGRPATPPAGAPRFMQLAEDQENYACGFWPGNVSASGLTLGGPAYYAYAFPAPAGFDMAAVRPADAHYRSDFGLFILPYESVRTAADPAAAVLDFLESTYDAAAALGDWDRAALESA